MNIPIHRLPVTTEILKIYTSRLLMKAMYC